VLINALIDSSSRPDVEELEESAFCIFFCRSDIVIALLDFEDTKVEMTSRTCTAT
jgi:hypothetical protein